MEFTKRFKMTDVWPDDLLAKMPEYKDKTMYEVLYENGEVNKFPAQQVTDSAGNTYKNHEMEHFGLSSAMIKGIVKSFSEISDLK